MTLDRSSGRIAAALSFAAVVLVPGASARVHAGGTTEDSSRHATAGELTRPAVARPSHRPRLTWRPPRLAEPTTIKVRTSNHLELDPARDYILRLPRTRRLTAGYGCIHISGGHNVVVVGGECYVPKQENPTEGSGRVFYIEQNTGTVHLEGLYAYGPGLTEGIDIFDSPKTVLQVENVRIETVHNWGDRGIHSDLIQSDSLAALRVDRFTGSSQLQGIFRAGASPAPRGADLRRVNIDTNVPGSVPARALWQDDAFWYRMTLRAFYLTIPRDRSIGRSVWPGTDQTFPPRYRAIVRRDGSVAWSRGARISGSVRPGRPPRGDFVRRGVAGRGYISPGYRTRSTRTSMVAAGAARDGPGG